MTEEELLARLRPGCICKGIKLHAIILAIENGAQSFEAISMMTGIGGGSCKSRRCKEKIQRLLREMHDIRRETNSHKSRKEN